MKSTVLTAVTVVTVVTIVKVLTLTTETTYVTVVKSYCSNINKLKTQKDQHWKFSNKQYSLHCTCTLTSTINIKGIITSNMYHSHLH